jgi:P4 family phage/plasmid primase-like protien
MTTEQTFEQTMLESSLYDQCEGLTGQKLQAKLEEINTSFEIPVEQEFIDELVSRYPDKEVVSPTDTPIQLLQKIIATGDPKELLTDETINFLAVLKTLNPIAFTLNMGEIKEAFGKKINLVHFNASIKHAQRVKLQEEKDAVPDIADIALEWSREHRQYWGYDTNYDVWRVWNGTYWEEQKKDHELNKYAVGAIHDHELTVNTRSGIVLFNTLVEGHCKREFISKPGLINFANGTLELATGQLRSYSIEDELTYCLPYTYDQSGFHPAIDRFLIEVLPDEYARLALMAHAGLALMRDTKIHQFLGLIGATRAGKSTILALFNALCGAKDTHEAYNFAGPSIFSRELEGKRARFKWSNRLIVAVDELPQEALKDEENLKIMSAHGGTEMRGIGKDEQSNNRWLPKLIFTTNDQPSYKDNSGAVKERAVFSEIAHAKPKEERDPNLFDKLLPELGAFAASCIEVASQVLKEGHGWYPQSKAMKKLIDRIANESNPLKHFIHDQCVLKAEYKVPTDTLYEHYKTFCDESGHKGVLAKTNFAKTLRMMNIGVEPRMIRIGNTNVRGLVGIRLRTDEDPHEDDFYQDDEPLQKPERMLTGVNSGNLNNGTTVNGFKQPVERAEDDLLTVLTEKEGNNRVSRHMYISQGTPNGDEYKHVSIGEYREENPLTLLTSAVNQPVERAEYVNSSDHSKKGTVNIFQKGDKITFKGEYLTIFLVKSDVIMAEKKISGKAGKPIRIEAEDFHLIQVIGK